MPTSAPSSSIPVLVSAMALVASCFAVAMVYFQASGLQVQRETQAMLANAVPSSDQLTLVRTTLRRLDASLDEALLIAMEGRAFDRAPIDNAWHQMELELQAYRRIPYYDGEEAMNLSLDEALRRLDGMRKEEILLLSQARVQASHELANGAYRTESDRVDDQLRRLADFNVAHATNHALEIDRIRKRNWFVGIALGVFNLMLAMAATVVAARAVRRQNRIQEARASELEMFSARVAHDLMSPLAAVSLALELNRRDPNGDNATRLSTGALSALKRVRQIVDALLEFARSGGRPSLHLRASANEVLAGVIEEVRPQAQAERIELGCEPFEPTAVACSAGVLTVLITNLLRNAIKFMDKSATRRVTLRVQPDLQLVRFEIEDTGPGLPEGLAQAAFEPYVRGPSQVPGLGLGLATVKRLVEAHRGRVGVLPATGGGALFWFELPRAAEVAASS